MPRAPKHCGHHGCHTTTPGGRTYCTTHEQQRQTRLAATRTATTLAKYGHDHRRLRAAVAPHVATGNVLCTRCGHPINPTAPWDLDHTDDGTQYLGPAHRRCNRSYANTTPHS